MKKELQLFLLEFFFYLSRQRPVGESFELLVGVLFCLLEKDDDVVVEHDILQRPFADLKVYHISCPFEQLLEHTLIACHILKKGRSALLMNIAKNVWYEERELVPLDNLPKFRSVLYRVLHIDCRNLADNLFATLGQIFLLAKSDVVYLEFHEVDFVLFHLENDLGPGQGASLVHL